MRSYGCFCNRLCSQRSIAEATNLYLDDDLGAHTDSPGRGWQDAPGRQIQNQATGSITSRALAREWLL